MVTNTKPRKFWFSTRLWLSVLVSFSLFSTDLLAQSCITPDGQLTDWTSIFSPSNTITSKALVRDSNSTNDNQFTGGSQDPDHISEWAWSKGNTNNKGDISMAGAIMCTNGGQTYMCFFGDRTSNNGDADIGFWFFKDNVAPVGTTGGGFSGAHEEGDILVLIHFTQGGREPTLEVYEWGSDNQLHLAGTGIAKVNNEAIEVPDLTFNGVTWRYNTEDPQESNQELYPVNTFFEGCINLTALGLSTCYNSFLVETRNSQSLTASLQDFVAGAFPASNNAGLPGSATACINTAIPTITHTTTGATGIGTPTGLPTGVTATFANNTITISGTPTVSGTFNYSIPLTGGCGNVSATGQIIVTAANNAGLPVTRTLCIGTALSPVITHNTTGATSIGAATGLPTGVTATFANNTITISGTPTVSGTFNYSVPLVGGCGNISATGQITVTPNNTVTGPGSGSVCVNQALTPITHTTTGATGIGSASGLPAGVTAVWANNVITISGTPTATGTFNYTIPLTGGCGTVSATGTITVVNNNTVNGPFTRTLCVGTAMTPITHTTTGATGINTSNTGLPTGVTASFANNTITISGTPTVTGTFNYTIPLTGGCGNVSATGTITVTPNNTVNGPFTQTLCVGTAMTPITHTTTGATGINTSNTGLPAGVTATFANNTITISGTPTATGTFNYTIPLTGGCGNVNATGTITVTPNNTVNGPFTRTLCVGTAMTAITHTTTGATGIGTPTGLPAGVQATFANNTITISGTPTATGTFNYTIPLTGGCGTVSATGTITVLPNNTVNGPFTQTLCVNTALTPITFSTTGATGIGTPTGLPTGVQATFANNTITVSGTPTVTGTFNFSILLTGGCGTVYATGTITVDPCNLEGCTPGYWKNHPEAWTGCYSPNADFFTTFGITNTRGVNGTDQNFTLMEAIGLGGGGYYALARHAVAALLNACHSGVDYPFSTTQIINAVRAAFNSGVSGTTYIGDVGGYRKSYTSVDGLKDVLAAANELGCPLNNQNAVQAVTTRAATSGELTLLASPNPYNSTINFNFVSPLSGVANLEIYDLMGRKLAKVFEGQVEKGVPRTIYYRVPSELRVPMIYRLTIGDKTSFGKLLPGSTD